MKQVRRIREKIRRVDFSRPQLLGKSFSDCFLRRFNEVATSPLETFTRVGPESFESLMRLSDRTVKAFFLFLNARLGAFLAAVMPRAALLRCAGVYMPGRLSLARIIQAGLRSAPRLSLLEPVGPQSLCAKALVSAQLCKEYTEATADIPFLLTGIYPTDGVVLWSLIKAFRPEVFIETGTGTGVSSQICVRALQKFVPGARFVTIGTGTEEVMETASHNLAPFSEAEIIKGLAPDGLAPIFDELRDERLGMFIDGPKGSSPDFWRLLEAVFERFRPGFVAVHDCEEHISAGFDPKGKRPGGHINVTRVQLVAFHESRLVDEYELFFMDNEWCEAHDDLNSVVYESGLGLVPYVYKGSHQVSHSPFIGVLVNRHASAEIESVFQSQGKGLRDLM